MYFATEHLTSLGVTNSMTFNLTGLWSGSTIQIAGSIGYHVRGLHIAGPGFAGLVSTEDHSRHARIRAQPRALTNPPNFTVSQSILRAHSVIPQPVDLD